MLSCGLLLVDSGGGGLEKSHLLRTKGSSQNETGVAAGFGALDSPFLV